MEASCWSQNQEYRTIDTSCSKVAICNIFLYISQVIDDPQPQSQVSHTPPSDLDGLHKRNEQCQTAQTQTGKHRPGGVSVGLWGFPAGRRVSGDIAFHVNVTCQHCVTKHCQYIFSPSTACIQAIDEDAGVNSVLEAFKLGINFFDTSPFYGDTKSEMVRPTRTPCPCCTASDHTFRLQQQRMPCDAFPPCPAL